jgi:hypothetical protein
VILNLPSHPLLTPARRLLAGAEAEASGRKVWPWFAIALLYAAGCAALALRQAFASPYLLADDAREHVFWMFRYLDPHLFPHDPMADYFQSLAPRGYASLYWLLARVGIAPLLASKLIPAALSLIATGYFFGLAWRFFRSRATAALGAILFAQTLWLNSDLSSATPRAFFYPLFVAFLYYQVRGSIPGVLLSVGLEALFFPPAALLSLGVLGLACWRWQGGPALVRERHPWLLLASALALALLCLVPYLRQTGAFGPLVTYAEARRMPEFGPHGRVPFFFPSWWDSWVGGNGGIHEVPTRPPWFLAAFLWPVLRRFPKKFPLLNLVPSGARPVPQIIGAALGLFALAHLVLFHLYLPNRYTAPTMRVLLIFLAAGVLVSLFDAALRWAENPPSAGGPARATRAMLLSGCAILLLGMAGYPLLLPAFPTNGYVQGADPGLYDFFARQPATIRIASLADEANNLPTFCRRSIVVGAECAVPFHPAYYRPLLERGLQIALAQYSADSALLRQCLRDQPIDFWLLDRKAFSRRYTSRLLRQLRLDEPGRTIDPVPGITPLLKHPPPAAIAYQDAHFVVIDAHRLFPAIVSDGARTAAGGSSRASKCLEGIYDMLRVRARARHG